MDFRRQRKLQQRSKQLFKTQAVLLLINVVALGVSVYLSVRSNSWQLPIGWASLSVVVGSFICVCLLKFYFNWRKTTVLFQLLYCALLGFILLQSFHIYQTSKIIVGNFTQLHYKLKVMTLDNSSIFTLPQVNGAILAPIQIDEQFTSALKKDVALNTNAPIEFKEVPSYVAAYDQLVAKQTQAIVMNSTEEPMLYRKYANYYSSVKSIYEFSNEIKETVTFKPSNDDTEHIVLGISNDSWHIKANSAFTSGLVYTLNHKTKGAGRMLLDMSTEQTVTRNNESVTSTLGELALFSKEKFVQSVEAQKGITIQHAIFIDLQQFVQLLDYFKTIELSNDKTLYARQTNTTFQKGTLYLNKEQALLYATDKQDGFGERQQRVVTALLKKLVNSTHALAHESVRDIIQKSVKTDMSLAQLFALMASFL